MAENLQGPDQVLDGDDYMTTSADKRVKLRVGTSGPESYTPMSVPSFLERSARIAPNNLALSVKRNGQWVNWTYSQYLKDTRTVAKAFIKLGLEPHHSVGILGFNSPEWFLSDLGAVFAGGIATGIYQTNTPETCKYIAENSRANILVVENDFQLQKVLQFRDQLSEIRAIIQYIGKPSTPGVLSWTELMDIGDNETDEKLEERLKGIAINQCCHLVYTSGTTGMPKGVMISHDNLTFTARILSETYEFSVERLVSYLPLSHVAANFLDIFVTMTTQSGVYFADKDALKGTLVDTLKEVLPTFFFGVPRVWEKMQEKMIAIGKENKGLKQAIGSWAKSVGLDYNLNLVSGYSPFFSVQFMIARKLVFQKVKSALGFDKCTKFFVAAAPIRIETLEYFLSLDIRIMEIYGMSECTGPHILNKFDKQRVGTIGTPMKGLEAMTENVEGDHDTSDQGGQILIRGRNIMMGYLDSPAKTSEAFSQDGWLRTGDLGILEEDGCIRVTGRLKELIVTAGGENVPPVLIEENIKEELPCLSHVMLIGDQRKFISCLLTLKTEVDVDTQVPTTILSKPAVEWCEAMGSRSTTLEDILGGSPKFGSSMLQDVQVMKGIQEGIDRANLKAISNAQRVQKWVVLRDDFSVPGGELGPTMKVKRHFVLHKYANTIEKFYK